MDTVLYHEYEGSKYDQIDEELSRVNADRRAFSEEWLSEQVNNYRLREENKEAILEMVQILEATYPGLWDIQVTYISHIFEICHSNTGYGLNEYTEHRQIWKLCFNIIIKFPELTITDSKNNSHIIRDLYVLVRYNQSIDTDFLVADSESDFEIYPELREHNSFHVNFDDFFIEFSMWGLRETLTKEEYHSRYIHSHLGSRERYSPQFEPFCLGSGEIRNTLSMLSNEFSPELFNLLLLQIDAFVRWESREGLPHIHMTSVKGISPLNQLPVMTISNATDIINTIIRVRRDQLRRFSQAQMAAIPELKLNWTIRAGSPKVIADECIDEILSIYLSNGSNCPDNMAFNQDDDGNYYSISSRCNIIMPVNISNQTFVFRGEVKKLRVIEIETPVTINPQVIFHPTLKEILKNKIEAYGKYNEIRNSITQRAAQLANS